jgi:hypothetical protein
VYVVTGTFPADPPSPKVHASEVTLDVVDVKSIVLQDMPDGPKVKSSV